MPQDSIVTAIKQVVSPEEFCIVLERIYGRYSTMDVSDEERKEYLLGDVFQFAYLQGVYTIADNPLIGEVYADTMYRVFNVGKVKWDEALAYYKENMKLDINPTFYMLGIRELFNSQSKLPFDQAMSAAFDRMIENAMSVIKNAIECHEEVNPDEVAPAVDPAVLGEFFTTFKDIKTFHRDREAYDTDEDKAKHDELMKLYYSLLKSGGSTNE